jgi:hypothetical protein
MATIPDHIADTIADSIGKAFATLTRAERQLANTIVENYPVSGLGSITQVAKKAGVSSPSHSTVVGLLMHQCFAKHRPGFWLK